MSKLLSLCALTALSACQLSTSLNGGTRTTTSPTPSTPATSSSAARPSGGSQPMTMPNLFGMTRAEAEATLARLGSRTDFLVDDSLCGSIVDGKIVERGQICYQTPAPGQQTSTTIPKSIRIQTENPYGGQLGGGRAWFLMPNVVGMHVDQAREALRKAGYTGPDVEIRFDDNCQPNIVCETHPEALNRTETTSGKRFSVGRPIDPSLAPEPRR